MNEKVTLANNGDRITRIRELNDALRRHLTGGSVMITAGIAALTVERQARIVAAIRTFDAFTTDNDPHGEHDFGCVEVDGERVFFKIDAYDQSRTLHSSNAADPGVTCRVLTIMLADEW
jgi:Protein of unknown function (DUF3768)